LHDPVATAAFRFHAELNDFLVPGRCKREFGAPSARPFALCLHCKRPLRAVDTQACSIACRPGARALRAWVLGRLALTQHAGYAE
jgi:hypothetical protein